jgi:signal transduction histidine kinase
MTTRSYSMRQRLDLVFGILLVFLAVGGSVALELTQRQRRDAALLAALHEQERLVYELTILGAPAEFERGVSRLSRNLRTLQHGGQLELGDGTFLLVQPMSGRFVEQHLTAAVGWLESHTLEDDFTRRGSELRTYLRGLAASAESQSLETIVRVSGLQLLLMAGGIGLFLAGVWLVRRLLTTPLHRMADGIASMQRTGRLVKLPVMHANELGVVAAGFNQLAEQVEEQKNRLREHIVQLQRMNAELDRLSHLKDDFLATINHQVRTPLTSILDGLSLVCDGTLGTVTAEQRTFLNTINHNAQQLAKLLNDILELSTIQAGRRALNRKPDDVGVLLREANTLWMAVAPLRAIRLSCGELPPVYMDKQAIGDVLDQLLHNAVRHSPEHGVVDLEARQHDGFVEVSVHDHGPGIPDEALTQLFQPFSHIQTPDAPGSEGSGLGLAFCRELIERHRGSIRATSASGEGTTVTFTLPIATVQFVFEEACRSAQEDADDEHSQFGVLLVTLAPPLEGQPPSPSLQQVEALLRRHTHRGDRFVRLDEGSLAIVAVADPVGLGAMMVRLDEVVDRAGLNVRMVTAVFPQDGQTPDELTSHRGAPAV